MNHSFVSSQINNSKCARCGFTEIDHTGRATCEACGNTGTCEIMYGNMLLCMDCIEKEKIAQAENNKPENQAKRVIEHARKVDESIQVKQDLFNAETVEHIKLFEAIDNNPEITNKVMAKAEALKARFLHFQQVAFDARVILDNASNAQRAIQTQLNTIANNLRAEEREKLHLKDLSYVVEKPKTIKPSGAAKPKERAWTKADIRLAAAEYKVPIEGVALISQARNMHPKDAAKFLAIQLGLFKEEKPS